MKITYVDELLDEIRSWAEELMLRGIRQLGQKDIHDLDRLAAAATELQMAFLNQLVSRLAGSSRELLLGNGDEHVFLLAYSRLVQYARLGENGSAADTSP